MLSLRKNHTRAGWPFLTVILLVLFVSQIIPHDHCESGQIDHHSRQHDAPTPQTHRTHSHGHDTNTEADQPWSVHHHDLAQHVDSHFLRTLSNRLDLHSDVVGQFACLDRISDGEPLQARIGDVDVWVPEMIPILPLDSRAPPMHA